MRLEDQVVSLELAKRLKALGVLQSGAFDYYENTFHPENPFIVLKGGADSPPNWICSAFTVAELGELLLLGCHTICRVRGESSIKDKWVCCDMKPSGRGAGWNSVHSEYAETEADARAKMLCHLIEKGIIDAKTL